MNYLVKEDKLLIVYVMYFISATMSAAHMIKQIDQLCCALHPCADLLFFFFFFFLIRGEDQNTTKSGPSSARQRNGGSMAVRWRADGGPSLNASLVLQGIRTSIA